MPCSGDSAAAAHTAAAEQAQLQPAESGVLAEAASRVQLLQAAKDLAAHALSSAQAESKEAAVAHAASLNDADAPPEQWQQVARCVMKKKLQLADAVKAHSNSERELAAAQAERARACAESEEEA